MNNPDQSQQSSVPPVPPTPPQMPPYQQQGGAPMGAPSQGSGLAPNVAGLLAYLFGFITGIIFLILDKDNKFVRFHAWQSIFFGIAGIVLWIALTILSAIIVYISAFLLVIIGILSFVLWIGMLILWIICMVKAYNNEMWRIPVVGDIAAKQAGV